jgi:putative hemolysin
MGWLILSLLLYYTVLLAERIVTSVTPPDVEALRMEATTAAGRALRIAEQTRPVLAALLLTRILLQVLMAAGCVGGVLQSGAGRVWVDWLNTQTGTSVWLIIGLALVLATLLWGLGQFLPRLSRRSSVQFWLQRLSRFILFWHSLFRLFLPKEAQPDPVTAVAAPPSDAPAEEAARELVLLSNIVQFSEIIVREVMQPRTKVVALEQSINFQAVLKTIRSTRFSKIPVYDSDLDNVIGILYVKDVVTHTQESRNFAWQALMRQPVIVVPETKPIQDMLQLFKQQKQHLAVVLDEHGTMAGIVTLEDVLEEIIGDIQDEFDRENEVNYQQIDDQAYLFEGQVLLNDVCRITGLAPDTFEAVRGDADTLAGLALELHGDIPKVGETIQWSTIALTVVSANERRVKEIEFRVLT